MSIAQVYSEQYDAAAARLNAFVDVSFQKWGSDGYALGALVTLLATAIAGMDCVQAKSFLAAIDHLIIAPGRCDRWNGLYTANHVDIKHLPSDTMGTVN